MRPFKLSLGVIFVFICSGAFSQGFVENALLFSRTRPGGSARIQAMGGAQVALGGDFSSALSNPAGLGMYNRSEFTFSPALNFYNSESRHLGTEVTDSKSVFNIPGLSYVHHNPVEKGGFLGGSFGITMSRINDFQNTFQYQGTDITTSMADDFAQTAQGSSINMLPGPYTNTPLLNFDYPEGLAYQTFLINPYSEVEPYPSPFTEDDYLDYTTYYSELEDTLSTTERSLFRKGDVNLRGAQYQWSFAYGGNIKDKFFFGASIGITTLRYKFSSSYKENNFTYSSDYESPIRDFKLTENIEIDGSGLNFTVGIIYRFVDFAQVGVSFVTPTYYTFNDIYNAQLSVNRNNILREASSEPIISEYNIITPMKLSTGLAFFIGKYGLISGDVEFVNYGKARYDSDTPGVSFQLDNDDIESYFTNVVNYRFGAEGRLGIYRLRAGFNVQNNPYKSEIEVGGKITTFSSGVGVKLQKFFVDATWLNTNYNSSYSPYAVQDGEGNAVGPVVRLKNTMNSVMLTLGLSF